MHGTLSGLAEVAKTVFDTPFLTGSTRLAETHSGTNWQKLELPKPLIFWLVIA